MPDRDNPKISEVVGRQTRQQLSINVILTECRLIAFKTECSQPVRNVHCLTRFGRQPGSRVWLRQPPPVQLSHRLSSDITAIIGWVRTMTYEVFHGPVIAPVSTVIVDRLTARLTKSPAHVRRYRLLGEPKHQGPEVPRGCPKCHNLVSIVSPARPRELGRDDAGPGYLKGDARAHCRGQGHCQVGGERAAEGLAVTYPSCCSRGPGHIMPHAERCVTSGTIFVGSDTMATELKVVMDPAVCG